MLAALVKGFEYGLIRRHLSPALLPIAAQRGEREAFGIRHPPSGIEHPTSNFAIARAGILLILFILS